MDSKDLIKLDFDNWQPLTPNQEQRLLSILPQSYGVYAFRQLDSFGRFVGLSDIVYIGFATNVNGIQGRIRQYFHPGPTQTTNQRILFMLETFDNFEIAWIETEDKEVAKEVETELLRKYEDEHYELPPMNRRA